MTDYPLSEGEKACIGKTIVPAVVPENREYAGVNQAKCQHRWAKCNLAGYDYWCQSCLVPGKEKEDYNE